MTARMLILSFVAILFCQCKTKHSVSESDVLGIYLLDSINAAKVISEDKMEGFFENIRKLDMEIQMQQSLSGNRVEQIQAYKAFLQKDVVDFTKEETDFVNTAMKKAKALCDKISPDIFPESIRLLKTKARHYGQSVYYTREDAIVIPYNVLEGKRDEASFLQTMLHEIFHIYSRLNPAKRDALYQIIGFEKIKNLKLPEALHRRILLNPDGLDIDYAITLSDGTGTTKAVPLIYSKAAEQTNEIPGFFSYLEFALFAIEQADNSWQVQVEDAYKSNLRETLQGDFHRQIGSNTGYIIHPDEILADNFMLLAMSKADAKRLNDLKSEGRELLEKIETVLKE